MSTDLTENQFVARLKSGEISAFNELLKKFGDRVFNTSLSILQNHHDAEDITQEVFTEVFQSISQFNQQSALSTWIYRITLTKSLDFLRKRKAKKRFGFIQGIFGKEDTINRSDASPFYHPGAQLENKERTAILFKATDRLSENQRTAFILHKMEELSYAEVADVMKVTVASVESLLVRAKQNLRKLLEDYYEENEK